MKKLMVIMVAGLFVVASASSGICADVVGRVSDLPGNPVGGVQIRAQTPAGKMIGQAFTAADGTYKIAGLKPAIYDFVLDPLGKPFKGGSAVSHLGAKGLTIDWKVSASTVAAAFATEGIAVAGDPFGLSPTAFGATVLGGMAVIAGGVIGGYAAAGGFSGPSGPSRPPPVTVSPSL